MPNLGKRRGLKRLKKGIPWSGGNFEQESKRIGWNGKEKEQRKVPKESRVPEEGLASGKKETKPRTLSNKGGTEGH